MLLIATERKGRPFPGRTFWGYMLLYGISRFIIEFYRVHEQSLVGPFSLTQWIAVGIFVAGALMLVRKRTATEQTLPSPARLRTS